MMAEKDWWQFAQNPAISNRRPDTVAEAYPCAGPKMNFWERGGLFCFF